MKYLEFTVSNMQINRTDKIPLISGAANFFGVHFSFDDDFAQIAGTKSVEFYNNKNNAKFLLFFKNYIIFAVVRNVWLHDIIWLLNVPLPTSK